MSRDLWDLLPHSRTYGEDRRNTIGGWEMRGGERGRGGGHMSPWEPRKSLGQETLQLLPYRQDSDSSRTHVQTGQGTLDLTRNSFFTHKSYLDRTRNSSSLSRLQTGLGSLCLLKQCYLDRTTNFSLIHKYCEMHVTKSKKGQGNLYLLVKCYLEKTRNLLTQIGLNFKFVTHSIPRDKKLLTILLQGQCKTK